MMKHIKNINELRSDMISGTSGRRIESLEDRKYELKKDVKGAQIGDFTNVVLPKGTIIYNLPGGVFADHFSLKNKYASKSSRGPQYFEKPTFSGISIRQKPDILAAIEKNSKVLESLNEGNLMKDLKKIGAQIDYLSDADDETQKIWKKAGINPKDDDTIILYSYVNSWPETKRLLKKSKIDYKELEDPNSAGESFIVFKESTITEGTLIDLRLVNENVNDEIELALTNWLNALAEGDPIKITDLYLDNGVLLGTVAKEIKQGHTEIQAYFDMFLKKSPIGSVDTFILQNFGDICVSDGTYTFELDGDDGQRTSVSARYTYVWQKVDNKWMIATHHSSVNP